MFVWLNIFFLHFIPFIVFFFVFEYLHLYFSSVVGKIKWKNICQHYLLNCYRILYYDICYDYRPLSALVYIDKCTISAHIHTCMCVCILLSVYAHVKRYISPSSNACDYTHFQALLNAFRILHICFSAHTNIFTYMYVYLFTFAVYNGVTVALPQ